MAYATAADEDLTSEAQKILRRINRNTMSRDINVLLIGSIGSGKSTLVNSMIMAVNADGWNEVAVAGSRGVGGFKGKASVTPTLRKYTAGKHIEGASGNSINFWDFSGLPNSTDDHMMTMIALIVDGHIPENTTYDDLKKLTPDQMKLAFPTSNGANVMHAALYVNDATKYPLENLVAAVGQLATDADRQIPVFLIATKLDQMKTKSDKAELEDELHQLLKPLALIGSDEKVFRLTLYCSSVSPKLKRMPAIDDELCILWRRLLNPSYLQCRVVPGAREALCAIL